MKKPEYFRHGKSIKTPTGWQSFKSLNLSKKESWRIQIRVDGALGRGTLKVAS